LASSRSGGYQSRLILRPNQLYYGTTMKRPRGMIAAIAALIVVGAAVTGVGVSRLVARAFAPQFDASTLSSSIPEPNVTLTDQDGQPFRLADARGKGLLLFFGYTHCPDVCPTTLAKVATADRLLGSEAEDVDVAFVTVDPQRDTAAYLKRYMALFNPHFYGLTGSPAALHALYSAYHVWFQKVPNNKASADGYLMAHTSTIYFIDRSGDLRVVHDWTDTPQVIAHDMRVLID